MPLVWNSIKVYAFYNGFQLPFLIVRVVSSHQAFEQPENKISHRNTKVRTILLWHSFVAIFIPKIRQNYMSMIICLEYYSDFFISDKIIILLTYKRLTFYDLIVVKCQ